MSKSMTIFYTLGDNIYTNITNRCPCDCIFCIRKITDNMGEEKSLWLEREPTLDEIKAAFDEKNLSGEIEQINEIVFCGFGEPMERADDVIKITQYIKKCVAKKVRLNTNGLVRLINPGFDMSSLAALDAVSVSLNADTADEYLRVTRPKFGAAAYDEVLRFAKDAKEFTDVSFSIVGILEQYRVQNCRDISKSLGVSLRIR